jgi:hypothetical protein
MAQHVVEPRQVQQGMQQAGIAQIDFRRFDEPLADIGGPWL